MVGHPLRVAALSQEVGRLAWAQTPAGAAAAAAAAAGAAAAGSGGGVWGEYPIGTLLRILPNHSCLTAACHPVFYAVRDSDAVAAWRPCRGW